MKRICALKDGISPWNNHEYPNIKKFLNLGTILHIKKGVNLLSPGERSNFLYYINKGSVKTSLVHYSGQEKLLAILGPHSIIFEGMLDNNICPVSVTTLQDCELVSFSNIQIEEIIQKDHQTALELFSFFNLKYKTLISLYKSIIFYPPPQRFCVLLCILADTYGEELEDNRIIINKAFTQNHIAELLGVSRVTVANIVKEMKALNILEIKGKKIIFAENICKFCQSY